MKLFMIALTISLLALCLVGVSSEEIRVSFDMGERSRPLVKQRYGFRVSEYKRCLGCVSALMSKGYTFDGSRNACVCAKIVI